MIHSDANIPVCRVPRTCAHTPHPHTAACLLHTRVDFAFAVTRQAFLKVLSLVVASRVRGLDRRSKGLADRFSRDSTHRFSRACVPAGCRARATRAGPRVAPGRQPPPPTGIPIADHTGIVCENMHALGANLRKLPGQAKICTPPGGCGGCENIGDKVLRLQVEVSHITNSPTQTRETVESTHLQNIIARRLGAATFYRRRRCCPIRVPPRLPLVELYGACLRKFAFLTRAEWANLRKYALETARERIAKICATPKSLLSPYVADSAPDSRPTWLYELDI